MNEWTNIARTGTFTAMNGERVQLTPEFFDKVVSNYASGQHEAPLVFGHPKLNGPAFGWVSELRRLGDFLQAKFKQVPDAVKKLVESGAYKKVSASFFRDEQLRHVGLLGATPPAIDGLGDVQFESGDKHTSIEFSMEEDFMDPKERIKELEDQLKAEKKAREDAESARDTAVKEFADFKAAQTKKDRAARFERLVEQGKVTPGDKKKVMAFAAALAESESKVEFADGKEESAEEAYWKELEAKDAHGLFGEFASADKVKTEGSESLDTTGLTAKV